MQDVCPGDYHRTQLTGARVLAVHEFRVAVHVRRSLRAWSELRFAELLIRCDHHGHEQLDLCQHDDPGLPFWAGAGLLRQLLFALVELRRDRLELPDQSSGDFPNLRGPGQRPVGRSQDIHLQRLPVKRRRLLRHSGRSEAWAHYSTGDHLLRSLATAPPIASGESMSRAFEKAASKAGAPAGPV